MFDIHRSLAMIEVICNQERVEICHNAAHGETSSFQKRKTGIRFLFSLAINLPILFLMSLLHSMQTRNLTKWSRMTATSGSRGDEVADAPTILRGTGQIRRRSLRMSSHQRSSWMTCCSWPQNIFGVKITIAAHTILVAAAAVREQKRMRVLLRREYSYSALLLLLLLLELCKLLSLFWHRRYSVVMSNMSFMMTSDNNTVLIVWYLFRN